MSVLNIIEESEQDVVQLEQLYSAVSEHLNALADAVDKVSHTITTTSTSSVLEPAIVVIIGAFTAYLFNLFHWRMVENRKSITNISDGLIQLILRLEDVSVNYWLSCYAGGDNEIERQVSEIKIKSDLLLIAKFSKTLLNKTTPRNNISIGEDLENQISILFDLATGGEFESKTRLPSKSNASKISTACVKLRFQIAELA